MITVVSYETGRPVLRSRGQRSRSLGHLKALTIASTDVFNTKNSTTIKIRHIVTCSGNSDDLECRSRSYIY